MTEQMHPFVGTVASSDPDWVPSGCAAIVDVDGHQCGRPLADHLPSPLHGPVGVWIAHGERLVVPFRTEVEALRYALANYMNVQFVEWGKETTT